MWYVPWPESLKKRACRYLLQRYLGQFLEEKLTLDQLSVDLYNGTGTVADVSLDVQALNELGEQQNWPMEFVDGYIEQISISIPWSAILKDSSFVEVRGFTVTIQPKHRTESATSMFESMWESMTSSMQLAQECLKQDANNLSDSGQPLEGIERFAQTIDSILSRVKVRFVNTVIRLEHVPKDCLTGVAMQINIQNMEYLDEAGSDPPTGETILSTQEQNKAYVVSSFTTKKFYLEGVSFHTDEFPSRDRTFSKSMMAQSQASFTQEKLNDSLVSQLLDDKLPERTSKDSESEYYMSESNLDDEPRTLTENFNDHFSEKRLIMFGKLSGRQEIRLRLKQSEAITGPKVSLDMTLGAVMLFLSPRQVHVLLELANGLTSPDIEDSSNIAPRQRCTEKPMGGADYQRIEQELQQQLHPLSTYQSSQNLQHTQGWSTAQLEDSDNDGDFLPMRATTSTNMADSTVSGVSSSMDSSMSSSIASSTSGLSSQRSPRRASNIDNDPSADITHFEIRLASLALVILHEDLLSLSTEKDKILVPSSVTHMKHTAESFFSKLGLFAIGGYGNRDFENAKSVFEKACQLNHLRLLAAPLQIEGDEKTTLTASSLTGNLTVAKLELLECLWDKTLGTVEYIKLLSFLNDDSLPGVIPTKPSLKISFKHNKRAVKTGLSGRVYAPKTEIITNLDACVMELDITIVDRICALLYPQPVCERANAKANLQSECLWTKEGQTPHAAKENDYRLDIKMLSSSFTVKLRFPIPDFRPHHDMQRSPWWKRSVRPDYCLLEMNDVTAHTNLYNGQPFQKYVLECKTVNVLYNDGESPIHLPIGKAGLEDKYSLREGFNWPRLVLQIYPLVSPNIELEDHEDVEMSQYSQYYMGPQLPKQPGPFSAKKVVHESDTPHTKPQQEDTEELIIPGDKQEMSEFMDYVVRCCRIKLDITFPVLSAQLVSKHIYELLYNRINTDLLLWEPSAPKYVKNSPTLENLSSYENLGTDMQESIYPMFSMCKSGIQYESDDSDCSESSDPSETSVFYSVYESRKLQKQKRKAMKNEQTLRSGQSAFVMNMYVGQGILGMNSPVRDSAGNVIPSHHGEFLLNVEDAHIFSVSGFQGDDDLGYVCVQAKTGILHHCDMISTPSQSPPLRDIGSAIARHLHPTIYRSERGILIGSSDRGCNRDMVSVAIKIQASHETHHVKTVRVAIGINKATLLYRVCPEPNSFISHMKDFFNVLDYPVPGYHAKDVLTELHLHLWDCAIDYRPLYLPLRTAVTMGSFSMSSHLSAQANTSTLRFIAEECSLWLSEKAPPRNGVASIAEVDLKRDYVGVIDLGLFELSLRTSDKKSGLNPHFDLRASNNIVHIRTCADTGRALMQLITYFASDGDLALKEVISLSGSNVSSPRHQPEEELVSVVEPQDISNLSKSQHQHVNDLLGEAMKESLSASVGTNSDLEQSENLGGAQVFYFPDENNQLAGSKLPVQVAKDLGDVDIAYNHHHHLVTTNSNKSSDTDDDFCFVGHEAGLGILPKSGLPEIRWLTEDPVRVIDNHFTIPAGKTDLLKPPKHYPVAVERYTLCEMTLIWHLYGGNDFKSHDDGKTTKSAICKKTVNFSDVHAMSRGVSYSKSAPGEVSFSAMLKDDKKQKMSWQEKGGVNRDHDVLMELQLNKVKFQHEEYPKETVQASRQVLLISELEVRDRLASSHINKFLYQHTSQARPKQSHAHMIVVKAVHVRPDTKLQRQECCLKVSLLPLRLNIDQDALLFLINFFTQLGDTTLKCEEEITSTLSRHNTPTHQPPVMTVSMEENEEEIKEQAKKMVMDNLILLEEDNLENQEEADTSNSHTNVEASPPIYFRSVVFSPEVPIRLDYEGKSADILSNPHGPLAGLLLGLAQLHCSELRLKRLSHRHGLLGADKLISYCLQEWLSDIKKNQLPSLLGGVGPMHSLVQLFQGIRDLFWLPIEQYQKDGRIVRGLQRGANSFTTSTAMAALELTSRIIHLIQATAETAYDMVSPGPSVRKRPRGNKGRRKRYTQPQDIREGMANAYMLVKEGIGETADNLVRVASQEHEQKGYSGAVGGVLRQIPPTFVKPIIIASEATNNVLGGMRSQLVPDARREANQKWRDDDG